MGTADLAGDRPVVVLSFSPVALDQRVLRQCALLRDMGCAPLVVAYADADVDIGLRLARRAAPQPTLAHRLATLACQLPAHLGESAAHKGFWARGRHRWAIDTLLDARPRLVIANDWPALVVAAEAKRRIGCRVHYDAHEFATLEFNERAWWRIVYKPYVSRLERMEIAAADSVSTVSTGLAKALQQLYQLNERPAVIRSVSDTEFTPEARPCRWPLQALFHGYLLPDRGLEALVQSMPRWRERHTLLIRGDGEPGYLRRLRALAGPLVAEGRVRFARAVPYAEVISAASEADLGVFFTPLRSAQHHVNLPNKVFEYIAAGLAIAVSPGADLKALVETHRVGVVSAGAEPDAIADAINALTPDLVNILRGNARAASAELRWVNERQILADVILRHLPDARRPD